MISKKETSWIRSLHLKKFRAETGLFLAEGEKVALELLHSSITCQGIYALRDWIEELKTNFESLYLSNSRIIHEISESDLKKISTLATPNKVLVVAKRPEPVLSASSVIGSWSILLDGIQDPGNLGTIVRIADWFGIRNILCSEKTSDLYNPKTIQSTMGSFCRVSCHYINAVDFLKNTLEQHSIPVYAAALNGKNIRNLDKRKPGIIILGNESKGVSSELMAVASEKITIPFPGLNASAESLNVAVAAGIICYELIQQS